MDFVMELLLEYRSAITGTSKQPDQTKASADAAERRRLLHLYGSERRVEAILRGGRGKSALQITDRPQG